MGNYVAALVVDADGKSVGGAAPSLRPGGVSASHIAKWNGTWSAFGTGTNESSFVYDLAVLPNGDLVAGGTFFLAGDESVANIARWNGTSWNALCEGINGETSTR